MLLVVDINCIYLEYMQIYSWVQQCQNVCLFLLWLYHLPSIFSSLHHFHAFGSYSSYQFCSPLFPSEFLQSLCLTPFLIPPCASPHLFPFVWHMSDTLCMSSLFPPPCLSAWFHLCLGRPISAKTQIARLQMLFCSSTFHVYNFFSITYPFPHMLFLHHRTTSCI